MRNGQKRIVWLLVILLAASFFRLVIVGQAKDTWFLKDKDKRAAGNEEEFIQEVYEGMLAGEKNIKVLYYGGDYKAIHEAFLEDILKKIFAIDDPDTSDDFDYMNYNLDEVAINTQSDILKLVTITISPKWKESGKETEAVNEKVVKILKELNLKQDSDYEKAKKIHDYLVQNFFYDESLNNYTVYDGMKTGSMICQGYMLLSYKLLTEAGVQTKCVDGTGSNSAGTQTHGWNLVKLGKYWYNFDTTWDDPILWGEEEIKAEAEETIIYEYFLKGSTFFSKDHTLGEEFQTEEFRERYPISSRDFVPGMEEEAIAEEAIVEESAALKDIDPVNTSQTVDDTLEKKADITNLLISVFFIAGVIFLVTVYRRRRR